MQLFPAIDLRGGRVVRLTQGDYDRMTVYGADPCAQARQFLAAGAKNLHVVDLDGAKDGTLSNYDTVAALAEQGGLYLEVGGGIRTEERIETYLSLGVDGLHVVELLRKALDPDDMIFFLCVAHGFDFLFNIYQWRSGPPARPCTPPGTGPPSAQSRPARR